MKFRARQHTGNFCLAERLLASQEGICSMELAEISNLCFKILNCIYSKVI
jgi:hypothetical protein